MPAGREGCHESWEQRWGENLRLLHSWAVLGSVYLIRNPVIQMSNLQAFCLGLMVAWTPSLLFLAWVLCSDLEDGDEVQNR